ncbi:MAG: hypothetical protein ACM3SY_07160 [Candidatus Omnitrophota bacterium]
MVSSGAGLGKAEICRRIIEGCNPKSIVACQAQKLKTIVQQNTPFKYADIVELEYMAEKSRWSLDIVKFSRDNLIVLGLLGTLVGLSLLVGNIDSVFNTIDSRNVKVLLDSFSKATQKMVNIIIPMQTAFSTSVAGLLGTLLLSSSMAILNGTRKKFFSCMESFFIVNLIPLLTTKDEAGIADDLKIAAEKLNDVTALLSGISGEISSDMENIHQIVDIFKISASGIIKSHENLLKLIESMNAMIHEVRENSKLSRDEGGRIFSTLEGHLKSMDEVNRRFVQLQMNIDTWISDLITPFNKQQHDFTQILQNVANENKKIVTQLSREITAQNDAISNTFKQQMKNQESFVKNTTDDYEENMKKVAEGILQGFQKYESTMMEIAEKLKAVAGNLNDHSHTNKTFIPPISPVKNSDIKLDIITDKLQDMLTVFEKNHRRLNAIEKEVDGLKNSPDFNSSPVNMNIGEEKKTRKNRTDSFHWVRF